MGRGLQKLASFETTLKSTTLVKTHRTTKDIQQWMKWSFLANYCCERGRGGAFCASHKQSFLPLSPAIERDTLARRDGWSGEEQSGSVGSHTAHFTPGVTDLSYDFTHGARTECDFYNVIFHRLSKTPTKTQTCRRSAHFYLVWINYSDDIHVWLHFSLDSILFTIHYN